MKKYVRVEDAVQVYAWCVRFVVCKNVTTGDGQNGTAKCECV